MRTGGQVSNGSFTHSPYGVVRTTPNANAQQTIDTTGGGSYMPGPPALTSPTLVHPQNAAHTPTSFQQQQQQQHQQQQGFQHQQHYASPYNHRGASFTSPKDQQFAQGAYGGKQGGNSVGMTSPPLGFAGSASFGRGPSVTVGLPPSLAVQSPFVPPALNSPSGVPPPMTFQPSPGSNAAMNSYVPQGFSQQLQYTAQVQSSGGSASTPPALGPHVFNPDATAQPASSRPAALGGGNKLFSPNFESAVSALESAMDSSLGFGRSTGSSLAPSTATGTELDDRETIVSGSSSSSVRDDLPLCENDAGCAQINDKRHQRQFSHTCRLFPCYHALVKRHAKLFRHAPGQLVTPPTAPSGGGSNSGPSTKGKGSQRASLALMSVNFMHISPDAPNAVRIMVSSKTKSYEIFGDWSQVKVHTLKRYLHQVFGVPPVAQKLSCNDKELDDDLATVSSCAVGQDSVIFLCDTADGSSSPTVKGVDPNEL